jgi:hypothetical protein
MSRTRTPLASNIDVAVIAVVIDVAVIDAAAVCIVTDRCIRGITVDVTSHPNGHVFEGRFRRSRKMARVKASRVRRLRAARQRSPRGESSAAFHVYPARM